jgi:S-adenosylmethionine-diacylglycerol 3-amino-3-carboxypropyl transferase
MSSVISQCDIDVPEPWALEAAHRPLAFAQVREDPRLDLAVLRQVRAPADVVMIASGGETAVCLARESLRSLALVDMNPAQLALCRLKLHLAATVSSQQCLPLLGYSEMDVHDRQTELARLCEILGLAADVFGPPSAVAALGADHTGRYEVLFARLRQELADHRAELNEILRSPVPLRHGSSTIDSALASVMALPNLVALFGKEATQNPRQPFHRHFAERVRRGMEEHAPSTNPFLWQMLAGAFPPGVRYDWLESEAPLRTHVRFIHGRMSDTLAAMPEQSADFVHLSNILDWLSERDATECLIRTARVLRPGGAVILRQLNSTLDIPSLACGLDWDPEAGAKLHVQDRSFFYHAIHIGIRP